MIPPFDDSGVLLPGIHEASMAEIEERFGRQSELRRVQMESIRWMVELAVRAGVERIILNGSFVTDIMEPNDVDCVLLFAGEVPGDRTAFRELEKGLPFLDIGIADTETFSDFVTEIFANDRAGRSKGMIEVLQHVEE